MDCCLRVIKCAIGSIPFLYYRNLGIPLFVFSYPLVCTVIIRHALSVSCMFLKNNCSIRTFFPLFDKSLATFAFTVLRPRSVSLFLRFPAVRDGFQVCSSEKSPDRSPGIRHTVLCFISIQYQTAEDPAHHAEGPHRDTVQAVSVRAA